MSVELHPCRPIGALGSCKVYRLCGTTVLTYPLIFSSSEFYLSHDMALLMEDIRAELKFISQRHVCTICRGTSKYYFPSVA